MRATMNNMKKELEEFKDKFDEMEVDRNKARNSQRIAEWKMRKALAATEGREFTEAVPIRIEEEGDLTRKRNSIEDNYNRNNTGLEVNRNKEDVNVTEIEMIPEHGYENTLSMDRKNIEEKHEEIEEMRS